jgi:uncharacterized protein (TIGR02996 family)
VDGDLTTRTALLRAVTHAPADDAPRLILADFLNENGEVERASLIRRMVAAPTYTFIWNQSRRAKRPKHVHMESVQAIRGLKGRLSVLCRDEWAALPDVQQVVMRRGFAEAISITTKGFFGRAAELFATHPFLNVWLSDLRTHWSFERPGMFEAVLSPHVALHDQWPAALFPDRPVWGTVTYSSREEGMIDLSRRAAGYARRQAGILREPPPLPKRANDRPARIDGFGV